MSTFAAVVLLAIFVALTIYISWLTWQVGYWRKRYKECRKTSSRIISELHEKYAALKDGSAYEALEKGMDEQNEAWEVELLSWRDQKEGYEERIDDLISVNREISYKMAQIKDLVEDE